MTRDDFRSIRKQLGFSLEDWGRALGYQGNYVRQQIHKIEAGLDPLSERTARLARMFEIHGVPDEFKPHPRLSTPELGNTPGR